MDDKNLETMLAGIKNDAESRLRSLRFDLALLDAQPISSASVYAERKMILQAIADTQKTLQSLQTV